MSLITNLEEQSPEVSDADNILILLKCDEAVDVGTITDSVSSSTLGTDNTPDGNGAINVAGVTGVSLVGDGYVGAPGVGIDWAVFCVINGAFLQTFQIGDGSSNHISIAPAANITVRGDNVVTVYNSANDIPASGVTTKVLIASDSDGNTTCYTAVQGAALAAGTPKVTATAQGDLIVFSNEYTAAPFAGTIDLMGFQLTKFPDGLPADIIIMADWTMEQWIANNKKFYPRITEL